MLRNTRTKLTWCDSRWAICCIKSRSFSYTPKGSQIGPDNVFYVNRVLDNYTDKGLKKLTLRQLIHFGKNLNEKKLLTSANYVRTELPVRLAHRIRDFQTLPLKVGINPHIQATYDLYWGAFQRLKRVPEICNAEDNLKFCEVLDSTLKEHLVVISKLALGMAECSRHLPPQQIDEFMSKALMSRIARRVVAEQHIALTQQFNRCQVDSEKVGVVSTASDPAASVIRCGALAKNFVRKTWEKMLGELPPEEAFPDLILDGHSGIKFPFVQDHMDYVVFEVLKNSYQASLRKFKAHSSSPPSPIIATLSGGSDEVVLRISDCGGGIPLEKVKELLSFARYDKARQNALETNPCVSAKVEIEPTAAEAAAAMTSSTPTSSDGDDVIASGRLGIGLPVVSNFMRYWGGNLDIISLPGLGCTVYLRFPYGGLGAREHLPFDPSQPDIPHNHHHPPAFASQAR